MKVSDVKFAKVREPRLICNVLKLRLTWTLCWLIAQRWAFSRWLLGALCMHNISNRLLLFLLYWWCRCWPGFRLSNGVHHIL